MIINWVAPNSGGSSINGYQIWIQTSNTTFYLQDINNCDGSKPLIVQNAQCSVPTASLNAGPFSLAWGSKVYAYVIAFNVYGASGSSAVGGGVVMMTIPNAPINIVENLSARTLTAVGFTW